MKLQAACQQCRTVFGYDNTQQTGKWCSNKCQMTHQYLSYIERWKQGIENGCSGLYDVSNHIRRYLFEKFDSKCSLCCWSEVNPITGKTPLQIDHIDGNMRNNQEYNLRLLCPNCHSLTPNFGSLNKGNGRYIRMGTKHPKHQSVP